MDNLSTQTEIEMCLHDLDSTHEKIRELGRRDPIALVEAMRSYKLINEVGLGNDRLN